MVELLVVLGIIALLVTISIPLLLPALRESQLEAAADELKTRFSATRDLAISHNTFTRVTFNTSNGTYSVLEYDPDNAEWAQVGATHSLPEQIVFPGGGVSFAGGEATFDPYGSLMGGGTVKLQHTYGGSQVTLVAIIAVGKLKEEG